MGFQQLCLVNPKSPTIITHENAIAMASGATDVLENTTIADSLEQALAPVSLAFALTARPRYIGPPPKPSASRLALVPSTYACTLAAR